MLITLLRFWLKKAQSSSDGIVARTWMALVHPVALWAKWSATGWFRDGIVAYSSRYELLEAAAHAVRVDGLWLEFGVYKGESINEISSYTNRPVYGFDSFQGLPETWNTVFRKGDLSTSGELPTCRANVKLVPGWFSETLPRFLASVGGKQPVALLHIDCDLYSSTAFVLTTLGRRIVSGAVIVFDEFSSSLSVDDEARAFREFLGSRPNRFELIGWCPHGSVAVMLKS